ncbi:hypothetical protein NOR_00620 [Metarhizium rileyi]|uniref:DUF6546 domain-containing protein n=1 Tax=Metarhizium rileyi (strain RCEF 4871) TaxID=1649241 RepID=A0A167KQ28_METRR|nr:hypothetical protein NOR_00620 [Metarhizium rileyi RCEF 4871]
MASAPVTQPQDGTQTCASWLSLPPEVRLQILDLVRQNGRRHRLALYATVCSEWQDFFEKMTFRHLLVDDTSLQDFARIMDGKNTRRTGNVGHIFFLIGLPGYPCPSCYKPENWFEIHRNNEIFTSSMETLLGILSSWAPGGRRSGGLTLELAIKSPSDSRHFFDDITTYKDYPFRSWDNLDETTDMTMFHVRNSRGGGIETRPVHFLYSLLGLLSPESFHATKRHLGSLLEFQGLKNRRLPRVEVINSLLLRRQFKRQMSPLALTKLVHESLVHITTFRLERWCRTSQDEEEKYLKEKLEKFHYFAENFFTRRNVSTPVQPRPLSAIELLQSHHGHRFNQVSVVEPLGTESWLAEMQRISANALAKPLFPAQSHNLERISFRSGILRPDNDLRFINHLLLLTAPVAENLPNLRSLEIFNTSAGAADQGIHACLFRYSVEHSDAILSWESYWQLALDTETAEFAFSPQVKRAWERAAAAHTGRGITVLIDEPKETMRNEIGHRQYFWPKGKPRLAEVFKLDAIHPFTRALMRLDCHRTR